MISVYAHIHNDAEVAVELQDSDGDRYAVLRAGDLSPELSRAAKRRRLE